MAVLLLKLLLWALSSIARSTLFIIFRCAALVAVLLIKLLKVPASSLDGLLDCAANLLRVGFEYFLQLLRDGLVSLTSKSFELLIGTASESVNLTSSAIMEFLEKMKTALEDSYELFPEVMETGGKLILDLWKSYKDAEGFFMKYA